MFERIKDKLVETIVFTGPESSGKTFLSTHCSSKFNIPLVEELAREYLYEKNNKYDFNDLAKIAEGQNLLEKRIKESSKTVVICDTDILTIRIWSEVKYSKVDVSILSQMPNEKGRHYFLCYPDIPWVFDDQRENRHNRLDLFEKYLDILKEGSYSFDIVKGSFTQRLNFCEQRISALIGI